ncbi:hypothetical protein HCB37_11110 [Listeria booriae]|uniref:hypothetical protein n=1 Tax=Listeria booriae TaxID=1552123 RepID=UPI0016296571|nr:hypothetical protein [Listeria booriae]MBC2265063.1 hypothetical protein [Listeria booriae]
MNTDPGSIVLWWDSDNRRKEKDYHQLEIWLEEALDSIKKDLEEADDYFQKYQSNFDGLIDSNVLPGIDYEPARKSKTDDMSAMIESIRTKKQTLVNAKTIAREKKEKYKKLADAE